MCKIEIIQFQKWGQNQSEAYLYQTQTEHTQETARITLKVLVAG